MYKYVQSCQNSQDISYRKFLASKSVLHVLQENKEPVDDENCRTGPNLSCLTPVVHPSVPVLDPSTIVLDPPSYTTNEAPRTGKIDRPTPMSHTTMMKQLARLYDSEGITTARVLAQKTGISENFCTSWLKHVKSIDTSEEVST